MEVQRKPPIMGFGKNKEDSDFVTVVSVGSQQDEQTKKTPEDDHTSGYVTVLKIGDEQPASDDTHQIEEVLVYRLPGERLGFGLKFEGGTKASEFVKRLFIQSCAADSPASRVRSSWGSLTEGDEVLEIDSISVKSMTRIDCVRCLKDSNVVIKLLVKHCRVSDDSQRLSAKSTEDLPLVISAEKKRTPPPPPPVPPRKIPRKKDNGSAHIVVPPKGFADNGDPPMPLSRQTIDTSNGIKNRHQSPRNSGRILQPRQSPEVVKRDRRLSDGSIGPPDAEVYLDLFSQESPYCLSESDDTGSSISTVVDRFSSFPTTTTSSFAGSMPSTPTARQKRMDLSSVANPFDSVDGNINLNENYLFSKLVSLQAKENDADVDEDDDHMMPIEKIDKQHIGLQPLQPPTNFQDAPLSYADEDVRIVEAAVKNEANGKKAKNILKIDVENNVTINGYHREPLNNVNEDLIIVNTSAKRRPPPPPPRSKHTVHISEKNNNDYDARNENEKLEIDMGEENLPRLVDFVPKSVTKSDETYETLKTFLENEQKTSMCDFATSHVHRRGANDDELICDDDDNDDDDNYAVSNNWSEGNEFYTFNWSPSSQLATIGEDEEECLPDMLHQQQVTQDQRQQQPEQEQQIHHQREQRLACNTTTPIVIVENADTKEDFEAIKSTDVSDPIVQNGEASATTINNDEQQQEQQTSIHEQEQRPIHVKLQQQQQQNRKAARQKAPEPAPRTTLTSFVPSDVESMETPSINTRQPPDGHEFPDYHEEPISKAAVMSDFNKATPPPPRSKSQYVVGRKEQPTTNVKNMIAMFSSNSVDEDAPDGEVVDSLNKKGLSKSVMNINTIQSSFNNYNAPETPVKYNPSKRGSLDLTGTPPIVMPETKPEIPASNLSSGRLHMRSQSLIDISDAKSGATNDRWAQLLEQRRKGLSKLKGLIIPEHPDIEEAVATVDLPEIKSATEALIADFKPFSQATMQITTNHTRNSSTPSLTSPIWNADTSNAIPKYSPAFKRKTLQVYATKTDNEKHTTTNAEHPALKTALPKVSSKQAFQTTTTTSQDDDECRLPVTLSLNDAPKSLESITSPTRSDCSFEYISSSSPELKNAAFKLQSSDVIRKTSSMRTTTKEDMGKSEDESDNDSAVSSSQSSYISRNSPPASPNHLHSHYASVRSTSNNMIEHEPPHDRSRNKYELTGSELQTADNLNRRLLKAQSVEAINRKNILASAKCRSGRDFTKGSPLIQRKFDEAAAANQANLTANPPEVEEEVVEEEKEEERSQIALPTTEVLEEDIVKEEDKEEVLTVQTNGFAHSDDKLEETPKIINNHVGTTAPDANEMREKEETTSIRTETNEVKRTDVIKRANNDRLTKRESLPTNIGISTNKFVSSRNNYSRTSSVTDLRKNFEKTNSAPKIKSTVTTKTITNSNLRGLTSTNSQGTNHNANNKSMPVPSKRNSLPILSTTTTSTTVHKTLTPSDVKSILATTVKEWDETFGKNDLKVIALYPDIPGSSIGITLAGGTDYETKDITIHKVRNNSAAYRDGRLHKGDRILSINGKPMIGITHAESIAILKEPVTEMIIVACAGKEPSTPVPTTPSSRNSSLFDLSTSTPNTPTSNASTPTINATTPSKDVVGISKRDDIAVKLIKDVASGLGFSMEGGKDSPQGDVPLVIKKLFTGGIADKSGMLAAGDELLEINGVDVTCMPRIDAWTLMKKIPPGEVVLKVRR